MKYLKTPQFTDCISEINNTEIDHAKDTDVVMGMYKLKYYSDKYSKTSGSSWQYYRDEPAMHNNGVIIDFPDDTDSASFEFKQRNRSNRKLLKMFK